MGRKSIRKGDVASKPSTSKIQQKQIKKKESSATTTFTWRSILTFSLLILFGGILLSYINEINSKPTSQALPIAKSAVLKDTEAETETEAEATTPPYTLGPNMSFFRLVR